MPVPRLARRPARLAVRPSTLVGLLVCLAACGSDATSPGDGVASVVVTGSPRSTMFVGDSVHLVATAVNTTGGIVSNQQVTWKSSAPSVAAVSTSGTVVALAAGTAVITATVRAHDGTAAFDIADGITIGTQGGSLSAAGGAVTIALPAGGVGQATLLLVRPATNAPADARVLPSTAYELGPDGVAFQRPATLTLAYDPARLPAGTVGESLQLYVVSGSGWAVVPGSRVNQTARTVTGGITRGGVYAVRSTPVDRIALAGAAVGGALYAGQSAQIGVTLYAATGDTVPMRAITWSSSAPNVATVDASGKVSAFGAGVATLTAATDGKAATTTVTTLARPTADWSRATDWTTYQGNSQHSGHIAATVDPTTFRERWVVTPVTGATYLAPSVGGGRLYLAMNAYFGKQQLLALDANDGSTRWVRDFGGIFGLNQPTYDRGVVYLTTGGHEDTYLYALNESDGTLRYQTPFASQWEHWKAPVIAGNSILTAGGYYGGMYAFDIPTGRQLFFAAGAQVDSWAPVVGNGRVYITGGGLRALNPTTGEIVARLDDARLPSVTTSVFGDANDVLTIVGGRLVSVDASAMRVTWEQSGSYAGMPVVGGGVVYGITGTSVTARRESDGSLLWSWTPTISTTPLQSLALTDNVLFVTTAPSFGATGTTYAIDLASRLTTWSYPLSGDLAIGAQGTLYIVQGGKVAAISLR